MVAADPALLGELRPDKLLPSTDQGPGSASGTLPCEPMARVTAAVDFLASLDPASSRGRREPLAGAYAASEAHEGRLRQRIEEASAGRDDVALWSGAERT